MALTERVAAEQIAAVKAREQAVRDAAKTRRPRARQREPSARHALPRAGVGTFGAENRFSRLRENVAGNSRPDEGWPRDSFKNRPALDVNFQEVVHSV
jgi:hypothetical protein